MIKAYAKGVRQERKIVNNARAKGLVAFRSAGSHSPIDLCIIDIKNRKIKFVQSKATDWPDWGKKNFENEIIAGNPNSYKKLKEYEILKGINGVYDVQFKVM